jgi:hypothetical protein
MNILFHIFGIALLEILFYFLYMGPVETDFFKISFEKSISDMFKDDISVSIFNIPTNISEYNNPYYQEQSQIQTLEYQENAISGRNNREENNFTLFKNTITIYIIGLSILFFVFLIKKLYIYFKKRDTEETTPLINNNYKVKLKIASYLIFGGMIVLFEYMFFKYVILNYQVISNGEIQYLMYKQLTIYTKNQFEDY